jgi:hypothetical protein
MDDLGKHTWEEALLWQHRSRQQHSSSTPLVRPSCNCAEKSPLEQHVKHLNVLCGHQLPVPFGVGKEIRTRFGYPKTPSRRIQALFVYNQPHQCHHSTWTNVSALCQTKSRVSMIPQQNRRIDSQTEGRMILSTMFDGTSNRQ